ncbi:cold-shock protein [Phaeodactylibacter luteus]|uniref:Cold shock domain-containing protein n=1 Tax=Phaeodactylibacter luteus TaxID=1564516 RepID=A0A5C6S028_9BACT|nr:cold shock domain-containing protein [Phaeodactylibacter luteus]TXB68008.1 cold shock domain-containing protein [Phaeodactylibacter luteus]
MADSYQKKEREKKKRKRKKEKQERKEQKKLEGKTQVEFMYVDEYGQFSTTPQDKPREEVKLEDITLGVPKREESDQSKYEKEGKVKFFNTEKGYGFILEKLTEDSYFVHINDLQQEIDTDDLVVFEVGSGPKGPVAINVRKI